MAPTTSSLRNIMVFVILVILAVAVFRLVGTRGQQQKLSSTPVPLATSAVSASAPTRTPYTPEYVVATGYPITPPPPTTPTPTPTFEPLTGQSIGGYVFSEARLVPGTLGSYIELVEWLPDEPDNILVVRNKKSLEVINVVTGETRRYSDGKTRVYHPVWLPARRAVAYLTVDKDDYTKQYLWINDGTQSELVFTTAWVPPLAVTPDGSGVILFDKNWQLIQVGALDAQNVKLATNTQAYTPPGYNHGELYQVAQSPDRRKALYFNDDWVLLADFTTGSLTPIDLAALRTDDMPPVERILFAVWDSTSTKIALNLASGSLGSSSNLFILEPYSNNKFRFIEDNIFHVGDISWSSDSTHIMLYTDKGEHQSGYSLSALYLLNINSKDVRPVAVFPKDALINTSGKRISWGNNHYIAIIFADKPEHPGMYVVEINQ